MVRPQLEYASDVWDPHQTGDIVELEKIQRRAARWVMNDYSSVTSMLNQLSWPTLQTRRKLSRLQTLHKIFYQQISLTIPPYYLPTSRSTRQYHPLHYILPHVSTTAHQNIYFSRTIVTGFDKTRLPHTSNSLPLTYCNLITQHAIALEFSHVPFIQL